MNTATDDFFRSRLDQMIELRHPLAVLASRMPWQEIEASIAQCFARQVRQGKKIEDVDLFGGVSALVGGGVSNAGRPRLPLRLMISLLYLKHAFNESDEGVVERWAETPTWQYFSGQEYFEHRWPCDPSLLVRFRRSLGEEGVEQLLASTINVAVTLKLIAKKQLATVIVDSTVMPKAIGHPTDSKMLETARSKLVEAAKGVGIELKQTYAKEGHHLKFKAARYAHAKQFRRMRKAIKRQWKCRTTCEFRGKVGIALTLKPNLIVGARSFEGNPYDGHTLYQQIEQEIELQASRQAVEPIIGHLKEDHRMGRCHLKGEEGDRLHAVLCAAGYNIRWLLRMIAKKGLKPFLRLIEMTAIEAAGRWFRKIWSSITPADAHPIPRLGWI